MGGVTPDEMREAGHRLWALANRLPAPIEHVRARAGSGTWIGPAADRFEGELVGQARACARAADEMRAAAKRIFARADALALEQELAARARLRDRDR